MRKAWKISEKWKGAGGRWKDVREGERGLEAEIQKEESESEKNSGG
jgi:hypothetical protein